MSLTFEESKDQVAALVRQFSLNRAAYLSPSYREAHARQEFIDKLFVALGWDVHNEQRAAPDYREVVFEDSLDIEGQKKSPDYVFRVGKDRKFFAEAKKPGVALKTDAVPAYQLRRYAWSAKLALSVLTDFEELAVYDCRARPALTDKPSVGRLNFITYDQYADRWRELWDVFSREAVWTGGFDAYAGTVGARRGTSEVDAEFLKEIEGWREALARNLALRNDLDRETLNDAVQRLIDRLIFLRMAEDRGIEDYGRLQRLAEGERLHAGLAKLARQADARYNSGLFDVTAPANKRLAGLALDDKVLRPILAGLYYPESPYEFSVLPPEILGHVYEQFLGKVIRLTPGGHAKIEEKPEVKKAGGVYYTPTYIVNHIVQQTLGPQVAGKGPRELRGFRVLDPACGSGSFLLGAYQFLLDHYLAWHTAHDPARQRAAVWQAAEGWRLTTAEKKRILTEHIFGVDIDRQAVEVTKLSLLLKVLENETDQSLARQLTLFDEAPQERVLPNLKDNIKCGNSLIGPDYFAGQLVADPEEMRRVNAFDWTAEFPEAMRAGGFDAVIGNPPYIRIQVMKERAPLEVEAYKRLYRAASAGNYDIYVVFVEKGLSLLRKSGRLGFILPHKFFNAKYGEPLRGLIAEGKHLAHVVHFGDQQVFAGATTYTCLLFLSKTPISGCRFVKVDDLDAWRTGGHVTEGEVAAEKITSVEWTFAVGRGAALFQRLSEMPVRLGDIADRIAQGIRTSANEVYVLSVVAEAQATATAFSEQLDRNVDLETAALSWFLQGREIKAYRILPSGKAVIIPYRLENRRAVLIPEKDFRSQFPQSYAYLSENRHFLENRERGRMRGAKWYAYVYPKNIEIMRSPKLLVPDIADRASFALDESGRYAFTSGYGVTLRSEVRESIKYILGLLNSKVVTFHLRQITTPLQNGFFRYFTQFIEPLPIRAIDFSDQADKARHDRMVALVDQMLDLHRRLAAASEHDREIIQRQIDATDREIDRLVYELYGLSDEEVAIVEGRG